MRADPKMLTAGPMFASAPKPSTNSAWMRSTRQGSVCTHSPLSRVSSSRWSVVVGWTWPRRSSTGPLCLVTAVGAGSVGSSTHGSCSMISVVMPRTVGAPGSPAVGRAESCRPTLGEVPATYESVGPSVGGSDAWPVEGVCENGVPVTSWMTRRATATAWSAYRS